MRSVSKKTNADYKREQRQRKLKRQEQMGERDIVTPIPVSVQGQIDDLCQWHAFTDWRELLINMVRVCHAAGPGRNVLVEIPKSGFVPTEKQLNKCGAAPACATCKELGYLCDEHEGDDNA